MRRAIIVALVLMLLGGTAFIYLYGDRIVSRLSVEGRRERVLRRLNDREILVRRACGLSTAFVDAGRWRDLSAAEQQRAADAIAAWCEAHGGDKTLLIVDATTRTHLGRWNGSALE